MAGEKSTTFSGQILALYFNGTAIPNVAINATSSPLTTIYCGLATADPTASGTQSANEVTYTGYTRVAVARTTGGWTVSGASVSPVANIIWPTPSGAAGQVATYVVIGDAASGAGTMRYALPLSPTITITVGLPPTCTPASVITEA